MLYIQDGSKNQKKLSQQLFNFCCEDLFPNTKKPIIDLSIHSIEDAMAWTDYEGDGKFFIEIESSLTQRQFIITFCHEMIHVCQFLAGVEVSEVAAYEHEQDLADRFEQSIVAKA
ncbi:MAG: hypothetical protein NZ775_04705 [Gammaproteobacteria bacterium]|nr:hypothetical protein [Gammaproteobacteria bacterium]